MDKKQIANFLSSEGYYVKPSQIEEVETLGTLHSVNSAGTDLSDYKVVTKKGTFLVSEELLPNIYGATAFSTEKKLKLTGAIAVPSDFTEEEEDGETTTPEDM